MDYHPYQEPGGVQIWHDDMDTIQQHINVWIEEQEKVAREEFIQRQREVDA